MSRSGTGRTGTGRTGPGRPGRRRGAGVHALSDELTIYRVAQVREELLAALAGGARCFDLSRVTECDSAGLQLLLALRRSVQAAGGACRFEAVSDPVREAAAVFDVQAIIGSKA